MKNHIFQKTGIYGLSALCFTLVTSVADAKPDKGNKNGGKAGHSEKGKAWKSEKGKSQASNKGNSKKAQNGFERVETKSAKEIEKSYKKSGNDTEELANWRERRFRDEERSSIVRYFDQYKDNENGLPPGLAMNAARGKELPPGWKKKLVPGYVIEDKFSDGLSPLSSKLFPNLNPVPDTRLYQYGDRVLRVYEPRNEIIDVIPVPSIRLD